MLFKLAAKGYTEWNIKTGVLLICLLLFGQTSALVSLCMDITKHSCGDYHWYRCKATGSPCGLGQICCVNQSKYLFYVSKSFVALIVLNVSDTWDILWPAANEEQHSILQLHFWLSTTCTVSWYTISTPLLPFHQKIPWVLPTLLKTVNCLILISCFLEVLSEGLWL